MNRLRWLPLALLSALVTVAAGSLLFSTFMMYDDEGYVLFSLKTFTEIGGLYERVFSQYGPFFFLFNQLLHLAGFEFTNTGGRLLTLVCWLGSCGLCASLVWRLTRSHVATVATLGGVFLHLWPMVSEPSHPGGFIALVTALVAWCGVRWIDQPRRLAATVGLAGAALLLTKINVGVFLFAGAGAWWALHLETHSPNRRTRAWLVGVALALMPVALMRAQFKLEWVVTFAGIAASAGATTVIAATCGAETRTRWRDLTALALAAGAVAGVTFGAMLAQGSSPHALLEGWLLNPLRFPQAYSAFVKWRAGAEPLALASLVLAAGIAARPSATAMRLIAIGRLVAAGVFFASLVATWSLNSHAFALSYGLSAAWLFVMPLDGDRATQSARAWLALLLVPQTLHAFPVAGSQISWGTFLWVPLAALGVHDAVRVLTPGWPVARQRLLAVTGAALMVATIARCANFTWVGLARLRDSDSLRLPGAEMLRLPENFTTMLRLLSRNASAHADVLFSLPGMHSFHLWTDVPPPTSLNATHWFTLLTPAQQEAIRVRLESSPRSCVIVQRNLYEYLLNGGIATESPLTVWLHTHYETVFSIETYDFMVRKGRHIAPLSTASLFEATPGAGAHYKISLTLAETALRGITSIQLCRFDGDVSTPVTTWTATDSQLDITPLNSAGAAAGPTSRARYPFDATGVLRLDLLTDRFPPGCPLGHCVLYLLDATGRRAAEARFVR